MRGGPLHGILMQPTWSHNTPAPVTANGTSPILLHNILIIRAAGTFVSTKDEYSKHKGCLLTIYLPGTPSMKTTW